MERICDRLYKRKMNAKNYQKLAKFVFFQKSKLLGSFRKSDRALLQEAAVSNTMNSNHATKVIYLTEKQEIIAQNWQWSQKLIIMKFYRKKSMKKIGDEIY